MTPDLRFADHGSIWLLHWETDAGRDWCAEHLPEDAQTWAGGIVIEPRYVEAIATGAVADGLEITA